MGLAKPADAAAPFDHDAAIKALLPAYTDLLTKLKEMGVPEVRCPCTLLAPSLWPRHAACQIFCQRPLQASSSCLRIPTARFMLNTGVQSPSVPLLQMASIMHVLSMPAAAATCAVADWVWLGRWCLNRCRCTSPSSPSPTRPSCSPSLSSRTRSCRRSACPSTWCVLSSCLSHALQPLCTSHAPLACRTADPPQLMSSSEV